MYDIDPIKFCAFYFKCFAIFSNVCSYSIATLQKWISVCNTRTLRTVGYAKSEGIHRPIKLF
jgi:hypothetical protein